MLFWMFTAAVGATPATAPTTTADTPFDRVAEPSTATVGGVSARIDGERVIVEGLAKPLSWAIPPGADRLVVRSDGWVGFVAPLHGWPAVFVSAPGGPARPLSNVSLVAVPGHAPEGFVAPPREEGGLRFVEDGLEWSTDTGLVRRSWAP